ncbi:hypothetical protein GQ54DRAFT_84236 [Martensiomyces pterosporus]|nr:hypothetical protein GQ54DRAFT_84236 [Martensiomyces pterosporus]
MCASVQSWLTISTTLANTYRTMPLPIALASGSTSKRRTAASAFADRLISWPRPLSLQCCAYLSKLEVFSQTAPRANSATLSLMAATLKALGEMTTVWD